jgi:predicted Zn-dependent protease
MHLVKNFFAVVLLSLSVSANAANADNDVDMQEDGIKLDKPSIWSRLAPAQQIEAQAQQQYLGLKSQAQQQGALVADNDPQVLRLRRIAKLLIPFAQRWNDKAQQWQWEVNLIDSPQMNAFCMPGGKIAFYTGILKTLKLNDDEVAMVMGHEIAHALREHGRERVAKNMALRLGAAVTSSVLGLGHTGQTLVGQGAQLAMLKFSRGDESEADLVGLDIAARAGFDPRAGIALWQKMSLVNKKAPPQWLSTHPAGENRIAEIRKHLPEVMPLFVKAKNLDGASLPPYKSNVKSLAPIL